MKSLLCAAAIALLVLTTSVVRTSAAEGPGVLDTLQALDSGAVVDAAAASAEAETSPDEGDATALNSHINGVELVVPEDPSAGIALGSGPSAVTIDLPGASRASTSTSEAPGIVSYANNDGSTTTPILRSDGTLQINTIINNPQAPAEYRYSLDVADGRALRIAPDGSAYVIDEAGEVSIYILPPWAKDSGGRAVPTEFRAEGNTLVQTVDHRRGFTYPIVADPQFAWHTILPSVKLNRAETKTATDARAAATVCGWVARTAGAPAGVLCGVNLLSVVYNAIRAYDAGKCSQLLIGPGVISTIYYSGGYCK